MGITIRIKRTYVIHLRLIRIVRRVRARNIRIRMRRIRRLHRLNRRRVRRVKKSVSMLPEELSKLKDVALLKYATELKFITKRLTRRSTRLKRLRRLRRLSKRSLKRSYILREGTSQKG